MNEGRKDSTAKVEHCAVVNSAHIYHTLTHEHTHTHTLER